MPQHAKNAPDYIDVQNLLTALGEDYSVVVYFVTRVRDSKVEVIGKTIGTPYRPDGVAQHVALVSFPVKQPRDMAVVMYSVAFDLWCQHDGGGATAAARGVPYGWNGRPETPRRRR